MDNVLQNCMCYLSLGFPFFLSQNACENNEVCWFDSFRLVIIRYLLANALFQLLRSASYTLLFSIAPGPKFCKGTACLEQQSTPEYL